MTPYDICLMALKDAGAIGAGEVPEPTDINDAFVKLNWMLAQWQHKRFLVWHLIDIVVPTTGKKSYTIGPGGDIPLAVRPDKLQSAFVRQVVQSQPSEIDYPLNILESYEDYTRIALKGLRSFPTEVFYDTGFPLGTIYIWPVPEAGLYEGHLQVKELLNSFTSLSETMVMPPEYFPAMEYNLALRLAPAYGLQPNQVVVGLARDSLEVIRQANFQIANLRMPSELIINGVYNPYSDQIR